MRPVVIGRWLLTIVVAAGVPAAPAAAQSFKWWQSEKWQKDLTLTTDQIARIDAVFQSTLPRLKDQKADLDRQEAELSRLIELGADESVVTRQVDHVESIRATLNKLRTLMLLHMRQVLTPDQRVRF